MRDKLHTDFESLKPDINLGNEYFVNSTDYLRNLEMNEKKKPDDKFQNEINFIILEIKNVK